jgi:hypothetical protein
METNKSWKSFQSILIISIIVLIFIYIGYDAMIFRPSVNNEIISIKSNYEKLVRYKIPEIDSTLKNHTITLEDQTTQLKKLNKDILK